MTTTATPERSTSFRIGFGILLFFTAGNVVGQIGLLLFDPGVKTVFLAWASFNLLAVTILWFAYRQREKWAWYAMWASVVPYALIIFFNRVVGPIYMGEAIAMAVGQVLTYREVFAKR